MLIISTQCFPPIAGGIETLVHALAIQINSLGEPLHVYADQTGHEAQEAFDKSQGFSVSRYGGPKPIRRWRKARDIFSHAVSLENDGPILLTDTWKSLEHINTKLFSRSICLAHGSEFPLQPEKRKAARVKNSLGKTDFIIANSNYTGTCVEQYCPDKSGIVVIKPGIETPEIDSDSLQKTKAELEKHEVVLITVARLEKRKGHSNILKTLPSIIEHCPSLMYLIVGDGPCRNQLIEEVAALGLKQNVRFIGNMTGQQKNAYLKCSDIFVMSGVRSGNDVEGFGMAYIEAGFFGLPCIAGNLGGAAEAVIHNKTGLVCNAEKLDQLHDVLMRLIKDRDLRLSLGQNAMKNATAYLWPNKIKEYSEVILSR